METGDRQYRNLKPGSWGKLIWYLLLLILVLVLMWQMEPIVKRLPF